MSHDQDPQREMSVHLSVRRPAVTPPAGSAMSSSVPVLNHVPLRLLRDGHAALRGVNGEQPPVGAAAAPLSAFGAVI
jgi:hypothetical protein